MDGDGMASAMGDKSRPACKTPRRLNSSWPAPRRWLGLAAGGGLVALACSWSQPARAYDAEVTATTAAQAYSLSSPFGSPTLDRRRLTQTLGLGVYDLLPKKDPLGPQLSLKLRLRFDGDFGQETAETGGFRATDSRFVPGLSRGPVDLMYGYLEGRRLLGGYVDFRLGRSYMVDSLGWWSYDGGLLRVNIPYLKVEGYGGYEQRGGLPFSTPRFERGGVWRGDRSGLNHANEVYPMFQEANAAPAYGVALESAGPYWIHARVNYRKVFNRGTVVTTAFPTPTGQFATTTGIRTSSERLGAAADMSFGKYAGIKGGLVYDLFNTVFGNYFASLDGYLTRDLTLTLEGDYFRPTFDGDSIWNWFTISPITTITGRANWVISPKLDVAASAGIRNWETDEDPEQVEQSGGNANRAENGGATLTDILGSAYGRYRWNTGSAALRAVFEDGERGQRKGFSLSGQEGFLGGKYSVMGRASLFDWDDELRPDRGATSVGYVIGGGWKPNRYAKMQLQWEHNTNRLVGQRYRVLALLNVWVGP